MLDEDNSGELDYHEFLAGIWSLCSSSDDDLCNFLFSLFDEDGSHTLDDAEVESALRMLHNTDPLPDNVREAFDDLVRCQRLHHKAKQKRSNAVRERGRETGKNSTKNSMLQLEDIEDEIDPDGIAAETAEASSVDLSEVEITLKDFIEFNGKYPILLRPAIDLRNLLRRQVRGQKYWRRLQKARLEAFGPAADLDDILFSKKRAKAAAEAEERAARKKQRKENIKKLKEIKKRKKEEAYQARVKDKWEKRVARGN